MLAHNRALFAATIVAALFVLGVQLALLGARNEIFGDFHAFYCGGAAVLHGADPYAAASIGRCEQTAQPLGLYNTKPGLTAPVPFPGYAFVLFMPFAALPYVPAAALWMLLLMASAVGAAVLLAALVDRPAWSVLALLAVPYGVAVLALGEVASIALFALCASALALRRDRVGAAVAWLCLASVLPHVVAPAFVALLVWMPRARVASLAGIAMLTLVDVAVSGPGTAIRYFTRVLPAHAQSEIGYVAQYGVTWMVHAAGGSDGLALHAGDLSYAVLAAAGLWTAGLLLRRHHDGALLVLVPVAFAVAGAPFMHYSEITLALPAILLLYLREHAGVRAALACALLLVVIPWQWIIPEAQLVLPATLAAVFVASFAVLRLSVDLSLRATVGALLICALLLIVALHFGPQVERMAMPHVDSALAQASWTAYIRSQGASGGIAWWAAKIPTWAGLLLVMASALYAATQAARARHGERQTHIA